MEGMLGVLAHKIGVIQVSSSSIESMVSSLLQRSGQCGTKRGAQEGGGAVDLHGGGGHR